MKLLKRLLIVLALLVPASAVAQTESVIYNFQSYPNPYYPKSNLIFDEAGNLYGTTQGSGIVEEGTVYQLVPTSGATWTLNSIHQFVGYPTDGDDPVAGLTIDEKGNLYGTTLAGGQGNAGVVFELSPQPEGQWTESIPYYFSGFGDPYGGVALYKGSLYGTTTYGGADGAGTVFALSPSTRGDWTAAIIFSLTPGSDGLQSQGKPIFDGAGNLYATMDQNGPNGWGTVLQVSPGADGNWNGRVLHAFTGRLDGGTVDGSLALDKSGNLYGTTYYGGEFGFGTVFELARGSDGRWTGKTLYNFTGGSDGANPYAGPTLDSEGNVYGTAVNGGIGFGTFGTGSGTVFELIPNGESWTEKTVYQFGTNDYDGVNPFGGVVFDTAGNLYGTTYRGGTDNLGTAFKIVP